MFVLVLLVRLMFLCNVNNVEPSSWTREQAAWPGGQPCQPRTENDSRGWSGGVVQFIPVLTSHHAQGTARERNSETTTETAQAQPGRLP